MAQNATHRHIVVDNCAPKWAAITMCTPFFFFTWVFSPLEKHARAHAEMCRELQCIVVAVSMSSPPPPPSPPPPLSQSICFIESLACIEIISFSSPSYFCHVCVCVCVQTHRLLSNVPYHTWVACLPAWLAATFCAMSQTQKKVEETKRNESKCHIMNILKNTCREKDCNANKYALALSHSQTKPQQHRFVWFFLNSGKISRILKSDRFNRIF